MNEMNFSLIYQLYFRYYKQSLNPNRSLVLVDNKATHAKMLFTYRLDKVLGLRHRRDLSFMLLIQNKHSLKLEMNSNIQKHLKVRNRICVCNEGYR